MDSRRVQQFINAFKSKSAATRTAIGRANNGEIDRDLYGGGRAGAASEANDMQSEGERESLNQAAR